jgi:hypothetical protein
MHILYLSQYFPPEIGATQTRAYEMARGLVQAGHRVTMLTEVPNHPSGIVPAEYRGKWFERSQLDGIDVLRVWVKASPHKNFKTRLAFYLSYMADAALVGVLKAHGPLRRGLRHLAAPLRGRGRAGAASHEVRALRLRGARPVARIGRGIGRAGQPARHRLG